jgi:hypothetical protein
VWRGKGMKKHLGMFGKLSEDHPSRLGGRV